MSLCITDGNAKIGKTLNISLPPSKTCKESYPCWDKCYARKFYNLRTQVRDGWDRNWNEYDDNQVGYFAEIDKRVKASKRKYFRWHVGGDVPTMGYAIRMATLAIGNPTVRFLAYTRTDFFDGIPLPTNLKVVKSYWMYPGDRPLDSRFPASMVIHKDAAGCAIIVRGRNVRVCPGKCESCQMCWFSTKEDCILFRLH